MTDVQVKQGAFRTLEGLGGEYSPAWYTELCSPEADVEARKRTLIFCPTARLEQETISGILSQEGLGHFDLMFTRDNPYRPTGDQVFRNIQLLSLIHI